MKKKPTLCAANRCTGCEACVEVCPYQAISMVENEKGFKHPKIQEDKCVNCLLCEKTCPIINSQKVPVNPRPQEVYACWHNDETTRRKSSSGGVFSALAETILEKGGWVWGASFDEDLKLSYQCINHDGDLDKLRKSKYIQCEVNGAFKTVKKQLKENQWVLFTGTSCHIKGLYAYLKDTDTTRLVTVDFVCHGVPSPKVFKTYVNWLEHKYNDKLINFNFRDKRYGWDNGILTVGYFKKAKETVFTHKENSFFYGMLKNLFIRECCHQCESNGLERCSDFTIGDFWGIGRQETFKQEEEKLRGISLIALNSNKATEIFNNQLNTKITFVKRTLEEAYTGNSNYQFSSPRNPHTSLFWEAFKNTDNWEDLLKFFQPTFIERCKLFIKKECGPKVTNLLRKILH